ncbi:MAG TPA: O-antigen ligase family protein [Longimicrobiales bacterium]
MTRWLELLLLGSAVVLISLGAVNMPWLTAGVVLGAAILAIALAAPLALVAAMLVIGPVDLSFLTGGFKALFPELGGLDMNGIRLLGATGGYIIFIMFEPRARAAAVSKLGRFWVAFLLFAGLTLALSIDRMEGARLFLKLAYPFLTFLVVIGLANTPERLAMITKLTLLSVVIYALIVNPIFVAYAGTEVDFQGNLRVSGLGGTNGWAFYCTAMLMFTITRCFSRRNIWYFWLSAVLVVWIALTQTRIAALAAVMGIAIIGLLTALTSENRKTLIPAMVITGIISAAFVPFVMQRSVGFMPTPGELLHMVTDPAYLYRSINWQGRQVIWALLWSAFLASPVWGLGLGSATGLMRSYFGEGGLAVPHNEYIRLLTDTGTVGLLLFAMGMGVWLVTSIRMSRHAQREVREFAVAAAALAIAWIVIAITDNTIDYYNNFSQYVGFMMAGAVTAHANAERAEHAGTE